jgi:hypothetical protein
MLVNAHLEDKLMESLNSGNSSIPQDVVLCLSTFFFSFFAVVEFELRFNFMLAREALYH